MEEIAANPSDDSRLDFLAAEYHQLEMFDEAAKVAERIARVRPQGIPEPICLPGCIICFTKPTRSGREPTSIKR